MTGDSAFEFSPEDRDTLVSLLTHSPLFTVHHGSLMFEAFREALPDGKIYDHVNRTRSMKPGEFIAYLGSQVRLPDSRPAALGFLDAFLKEISPQDPLHSSIAAVVRKYDGKKEYSKPQ